MEGLGTRQKWLHPVHGTPRVNSGTVPTILGRLVTLARRMIQIVDAGVCGCVYECVIITGCLCVCQSVCKVSVICLCRPAGGYNQDLLDSISDIGMSTYTLLY